MQILLTQSTEAKRLDVVFPDESGALQAWLDSLANLSDVRPWGNDNPSGDSYLPQEFRPNPAALPALNDTSPLRLRLNTIYYPTGATRWGVACFAVASKMEEPKKPTDHISGLPYTIKFGNQVAVGNPAVTLSNWWGVHYRQVTPELALIVLADDRYRWRWQRTSGTLAFGASTTWNEVITSLQNAIGRTITAADCDYEGPDPVELNRRATSPAELLEAVAISRGQRVVLNFDGTVALQSIAQAKTALAARPAFTDQAITGKKVFPQLPEYMTVAYTRAQSGAFDQTARLYTKSYRLEDYDQIKLAAKYRRFGVIADADATIHCTYPAEFRLLETDPENKFELDRLACRIVRDQYHWATNQAYDVTFDHVSNDVPCGTDDFICWVIGDRGPNWEPDKSPEYIVATRYASRPANSIPGTILAGESKQRYSGSGVLRVVLDEPLNDNGETRCKLVSINTSGSLTIDERTIKVTKPNHPLVIGPMADSGRFEFLSSEVATGTESGEGGSPTTTAQDCTGRTKWNWDGYEWTVIDNQCGQASTTSTTTAGATTTAAPTTTCNSADPCCTLVTQTTSTTTAAATTTAAPTTTGNTGCRPQYPTFCPDVSDVDACTWTFCADGESSPPSCQSTTAAPTTTSAGTGPPTTTGAPTTTAGCPDDCLCPVDLAGCHWISLPLYGGGWYWHRTNAPCCITCPCSEPARIPLACDEEWTDCVPLPPPTPPVSSCVGECEFWWIPSMSRWYLTQGNCVGVNVAYCNCTYPTVDGDICAPIITKCKTPATTTASRVYDPCFPTTTAGATTTAPPTTTPACGLGCYWECASAVWTIADNMCAPGCECYEPPINCAEDCEREFTSCRSTTTAAPTTTAGTTTTGPTTTAAPTTTQAACSACADTSYWRWLTTYWTAVSGCPPNQPVGCQGVPPARAGAYANEIAAGSCVKGCSGIGICNYRSFDGLTWTYTFTSGSCPAPNCGCQPPSFAPTIVNQVTYTSCACL